VPGHVVEADRVGQALGAALLSIMLLLGRRTAARDGDGPAGPGIGPAFPATAAPVS
jgi:hypothetical protein